MREDITSTPQFKDSGFDQVSRFSDLQTILGKNPPSFYKEAYEEVADLAKEWVSAKTKKAWNKENHDEFRTYLIRKYPECPAAFIDALIRCAHSYNPPVNIPYTNLWDID
ncbi:MAG: hypothetical protein KGI50_04080 [Patescibacteria group bacterium]|nr:hypothetical protein [Patescibacteria group bacterium]MDE2438867.1 hypothetical protein [Patescibacteria group bacterium]